MDKVVVGMSGGVDSAVAAYLLKQEGYEVVGVTLRTWRADDGTEGRCCEIDDARSSAARLGIEFLPVNCISDFQRYVVEPFAREYLRGRTPNPCIECNRHVKWEKLLYYAKVVGARYVATGHYASVLRLPNGRYTVKTALHGEKDQTYMLYRLTQEQLSATLMPLGAYSKAEVRRIAAEAGLAVASKPDSQEVCFVTDGSYADYIESTAGDGLPGEGDFVDASGKVLGRHRGIVHYTVGQRKGLGIALGHPAYVKELRPETNEVVLGDEESLYRRELLCEDPCFMSIPGLREGEVLPCAVKIRYRHAPQSAQISLAENGQVKVSFAEPVRAPAPGQSAVFYDDEGCVIGGGVIAKAFS
ncbi:MAG: tRNA 2-thiouridine(34) synthase MnmA [Oscillospiraceae bacterium]|nr:tRNA 2-thiouridine(34) synthase MnmA [Oscillospiraceae bacterium]